VEPPPAFDAAARRHEMVAAFDRQAFADGIIIGEELEAHGALDPEAQFWLAEACRRSGRDADAVKRYEAFIAGHPGHKLVDAAHYWAAETLRRSNNIDAARRHYKAVIADEKSGLRAKAKKRLGALR